MSVTPLFDRSVVLPTPRTTLVGRAAEVASACALLLDETVPLLTLTGPGGVGKTRLALAIAREVAGDFADGAVFVDLAPVRDPALVLAAIAQALDVREGGDRPLPDVLTAFLRPRQVLLLLDNVEHLLTAAPAVSDLLLAAPALQVLATSRAPLRIRGEHAFPISPLALPAATDAPPADLARVDSVALLLERARAINPGLVPTDADLRALAEICRRLDGLPLAIELAATRLKVLSPAALLARLSDRLRLLTGGPRDAPDRQRTMRDTIAWSYDLLTPDERALFRSLAAFAGGCTLAAAEAVCRPPSADVLDGIAALLDNSLLRREMGVDGEPRYLMLETVREFGLEQLDQSGQETEVRERHAAYFLAFAEEAGPAMRGAVQRRWLDRVTAEMANLRAAFDWLLEADEPEAALRLAGALSTYWPRRGLVGEGRALLDRALAVAGAAPSKALAWGLTERAWMALILNDQAVATSSATAGAAVARAVGETGIEGKALATLCWIGAGGNWDRAVALGEEAVALLRPVGERVWLAFALATLGSAEHRRGNQARAIAAYAESLASSRAAGDRLWIDNVLTWLGDLACDRGDFDDALTRYREAIGLSQENQDRWGISLSLTRFADVAAACGQAERAGRLLGATEALCYATGTAIPPPDGPIFGRALAAARQALGDEGLAAARTAGWAMTVEQAIAEAAAVEPSSPPAGIGKASDRAAACGLSPREVEVLRLLAQHRTENEIAAALFVSPRTVQTHVEHIRAKLGVENRREAAAAAVRLGLV